MIKIKVTEAEGIVLDWLVAKAEGLTPTLHKNPYGYWVLPNIPGSYSTNWSQGGPIIDREDIFLDGLPDKGCRAFQRQPNGQPINIMDCWNATKLQTAMRCYVTSKLGEEVEVPEELL